MEFREILQEELIENHNQVLEADDAEVAISLLGEHDAIDKILSILENKDEEYVRTYLEAYAKKIQELMKQY